MTTEGDLEITVENVCYPLKKKFLKNILNCEFPLVAVLWAVLMYNCKYKLLPYTVIVSIRSACCLVSEQTLLCVYV